MTYFETPAAKSAYIAGVSLDAYEASLDAVCDDLAALYADGQPHLDVEARDFIPASHVALVSEADREAHARMLDHDSWEGFGH